MPIWAMCVCSIVQTFVFVRKWAISDCAPHTTNIQQQLHEPKTMHRKQYTQNRPEMCIFGILNLILCLAKATEDYYLHYNSHSFIIASYFSHLCASNSQSALYSPLANETKKRNNTNKEAKQFGTKYFRFALWSFRFVSLLNAESLIDSKTKINRQQNDLLCPNNYSNMWVNKK